MRQYIYLNHPLKAFALFSSRSEFVIIPEYKQQLLESPATSLELYYWAL